MYSAKIAPTMGSPPRMRGKGVHLTKECLAHGITPAYAGKSGSPGVIGECVGDHPRVCGEKCFSASIAASVLGSPPRMRGKDGVLQVADQLLGITPAYAGKR